LQEHFPVIVSNDELGGQHPVVFNPLMVTADIVNLQVQEIVGTLFTKVIEGVNPLLQVQGLLI